MMNWQDAVKRLNVNHYAIKIGAALRVYRQQGDPRPIRIIPITEEGQVQSHIIDQLTPKDIQPGRVVRRKNDSTGQLYVMITSKIAAPIVYVNPDEWEEVK